MPDSAFPVQNLLFFVDQDIDGELEAAIERLVKELTISRTWSIRPPEFVNELDDDIETLGGLLTVCNALPPNNPPTELDRANLEEVKDLVHALKVFSKARSVVFGLELDQVSVGSVRDGEVDESLRIGFLEEWERDLMEREKATSN